MSKDIPYVRQLRSDLVDGIKRQREAADSGHHSWGTLRRFALVAASAIVAVMTVAGTLAILSDQEGVDLRSAGPSQEASTSGMAGGATRTSTGRPTNPSAVACAEIPSLTEFIDDRSMHEYYDTVFIGTVKTIGDPVKAGIDEEGLYGPDEYFPVAMNVERVMLGTAKAEATVMVPVNSSETVTFRLGNAYAVVAHLNEDGTFSTSACTPTGPTTS